MDRRERHLLRLLDMDGASANNHNNRNTHNHLPHQIMFVIDKDVLHLIELSRETAMRNKRRYRMRTYKNHRRTGVLGGLSVWQSREFYPVVSKPNQSTL